MENSVLEEKVFHKVMKNVPFGLVVSSEGRKRKVYYVNTMAYHMLGYTREEFIEKVQDGWSRFVDIDLRMVMREHHEEILTGESFELTAQTETKDGNKKWLSFRVMVSMDVKTGQLYYDHGCNGESGKKQTLRERKRIFTGLCSQRFHDETVKPWYDGRSYQRRTGVSGRRTKLCIHCY